MSRRLGIGLHGSAASSLRLQGGNRALAGRSGVGKELGTAADKRRLHDNGTVGLAVLVLWQGLQVRQLTRKGCQSRLTDLPPLRRP